MRTDPTHPFAFAGEARASRRPRGVTRPLGPVLAFLFVALPALVVGCAAPSGPVAVWVEVPRPRDADDVRLGTRLRQAADEWPAVPGHLRTYLTFDDENVGSLSLWADRARADAYYDDAWRERLRRAHGAPPRLTYFDARVRTPGGAPGEAGSAGQNAVVTIVRVEAPWYAPRGVIVGRMQDQVPTYASVSGLDYKVFTIADERRIGGIYLWREEAAARAFYDAAWRARIESAYGETADLVWLEAAGIVRGGE